MPIEQNRVIIGGIYRTDTNQQRKVTGITADGRVRYATRSGNSEGAWDFGSSPTLANSPTVAVFAEQCSMVIRAINDLEDPALLKCRHARHTIAVAGGGTLTIYANGFWSSRRQPDSDERDLRLYTLRDNDETADYIVTERELVDRIGQDVFDRLPA